MNAHYGTTYEVIDPMTHEHFITGARYIAEHHHYNEKVVPCMKDTQP